ncbi:hypothetical protein GCM10009867_30570 [Pedococcus aerophilus]|uniref:PPM-type phosphatase domain-containing protein n=1 Tax=Pedococcus aerophilus TaxID=436356 RepID=A0ABN3UUA9_9MICO
MHAAAALIRATIAELDSTQAALAEALIASQDRLLAVKALAQVNVRRVGSDGFLDVLLDQALALTGASQILLFDAGAVLASRGVVTDVDGHIEIVREVIAASPRGALVTTAGDRAIVGNLDPDDGGRRHIAFFRPAARPFSTTDLPLVEAISAALGVRLALAQLHRRELEQAVVEREHQLASALAQSAITVDPPRSPAVDLFARTVPASLTGGDFFVFGRADGVLWFAVGDVAGKGLPAAMLMTRAVAACRVAFLGHPSPSVPDVFARIEDELYAHLDDAGLFITLVVGAVEESSRTVSMVNAGHSPVVLVRDGYAAPVRSSVPPLGVLRGRVPEVCSVTLGVSDRLVVGTDGLVEQAGPDSELFGYDRFDELCRSSSRLTPAGIGAEVFATLADFASGTAASDDATLVVVASAEATR